MCVGGVGGGEAAAPAGAEGEGREMMILARPKGTNLVMTMMMMMTNNVCQVENHQPGDDDDDDDHDAWGRAGSGQVYLFSH